MADMQAFDPRAVPVLAARIYTATEAAELELIGAYLQRLDDQHVVLAYGYILDPEDGWRSSWYIGPNGGPALTDVFHDACIDMTGGN